MHVVRARITNYKGFPDSGVINLSPHFNVVVGANDSGKTALLEGISTRIASRPHRSIHSVPRPSVLPPPHSFVELEIAFSREELDDFITRLPSGHSSFPVVESEKPAPDISATYVNGIGDSKSLKMRLNSGQLICVQYEGYEPWSTERAWAQVNVRRVDGTWVPDSNRPNQIGGIGGTWPIAFAESLRAQIYAFKAERLNISEANMGPVTELAPNASNLAQVILHQISSNPPSHQTFMRYVRTVFPHIYDVTSPTLESNRTRLLLWTNDPSTRRADLAIPLQESGTGIGQVLAVLYVIVHSVDSRCIIIDEPQSFLHPGAMAKLIQIMRQHRQHQFLISTHSPNAILAAEPLKVFSVKRESHSSVVKEVDVRAPGEALALLADVGARLSDVFGADQILWVEGQTEEHCFPLIVEALRPTKFFGTKIVGIRRTSDFNKKDIERSVEIYGRLSGGALLIPPSLHFVLDSEDLTKEDKDALRVRSGKSLSFLKRRMYESYLLVPEAIAGVLTELDPTGPKHSTEDVIRWIDGHKWDPRYFDRREVPINDRTEEYWLVHLHAASLLHDLFNALTESRVSYKEHKVLRGVSLTKALLASNTEAFNEILALLDCIGSKSTDSN